MTDNLSPVAQGIVDMVVGPEPFGDQDRAILELERLRFLTSGSKHTEILDRFAMTPVRYYIRLNWLLDQPEATAYDPALVRRLVELRDKRREVRTRGTVAAGVATRPDTRGTRPALLEVVKPTDSHPAGPSAPTVDRAHPASPAGNTDRPGTGTAPAGWAPIGWTTDEGVTR